MRNRNKPPEPVDMPVQAPTPATIKGAHGVAERWRERSAARERCVVVHWLRRTANRAREPDPPPRRQTLLHYRAAVVRSELLEIAATLERAHDPDPAGIAELHELLANGCDSPLYNADIHVSELRATLYSVRTRLATKPDTAVADAQPR